MHWHFSATYPPPSAISHLIHSFLCRQPCWWIHTPFSAALFFLFFSFCRCLFNLITHPNPYLYTLSLEHNNTNNQHLNLLPARSFLHAPRFLFLWSFMQLCPTSSPRYASHYIPLSVCVRVRVSVGFTTSKSFGFAGFGFVPSLAIRTISHHHPIANHRCHPPGAAIGGSSPSPSSSSCSAPAATLQHQLGPVFGTSRRVAGR